MHRGHVEVARAGWTAKSSGQLIHLRDACSDSRFQYPRAPRPGLVSICPPLMVNGKAIGILRVYSSEERDFLDECDFMLGVATFRHSRENARMQATRLFTSC
ncbi:MAG: hypothetical protein ACLR0N_16950 [Bilophila wadsworthia]